MPEMSQVNGKVQKTGKLVIGNKYQWLSPNPTYTISIYNMLTVRFTGVCEKWHIAVSTISNLEYTQVYMVHPKCSMNMSMIFHVMSLYCILDHVVNNPAGLRNSCRGEERWSSLLAIYVWTISTTVDKEGSREGLFFSINDSVFSLWAHTC